jgi:hypothetical protein
MILGGAAGPSRCSRISLVRPDLGGAAGPSFVLSGPWTWSPWILC